MLRGQEQTLRSRLRACPLNAPFVIVLRSSRCALGIPLHPQLLQGLGDRVLREGRRFGRRSIAGCARCFAPHDPLAAFNVPALDLSKAVVLCGEDC